MKKIILLALVLAPLAGHAQQASTAKAEDSFCVKSLMKGDYAVQHEAVELCARFSQATLGCAMDMIDMEMESDLFEAIEYCSAPIVNRK